MLRPVVSSPRVSKKNKKCKNTSTTQPHDKWFALNLHCTTGSDVGCARKLSSRTTELGRTLAAWEQRELGALRADTVAFTLTDSLGDQSPARVTRLDRIWV